MSLTIGGLGGYYGRNRRRIRDSMTPLVESRNMIVDCHTHISCPGTEITAQEHLEVSQGVDACIVLGAGEEANREINKTLSDYVSKHSNKMVGFAVVNPVQDDISTKHWSGIKNHLGLDGAVLYCAKDGFHPAHSRALQFYETMAQLQMPVFFHNTSPFASRTVLDFVRPYLIDEVARAFPDMKIVIGGMGMPFLNETLCMLQKHPNVYADLTIQPEKIWQVYNVVISAFEAEVMDELFFGSGLPFRKAQPSIEALLGFNKLLADANLPTVPREKIRAIIERDTLGLLGIELR